MTLHVYDSHSHHLPSKLKEPSPVIFVWKLLKFGQTLLVSYFLDSPTTVMIGPNITMSCFLKEASNCKKSIWNRKNTERFFHLCVLPGSRNKTMAAPGLPYLIKLLNPSTIPIYSFSHHSFTNEFHTRSIHFAKIVSILHLKSSAWHYPWSQLALPF